MVKRKFNSYAEEWCVYILQTKDGKFYTGVTKDIDRRMDEHKRTGKGAKFFRFSKPRKVVFKEKVLGRSPALKREAAIKKLSRRAKLELLKLK
ncbi:MAG TPA: GIY-YIG nuclease family protein [Bdellovibrionota bacterium]|nr:GIY-YIG nuclease family protein [Bdellovibrionota bacterium]